MKKTPLPFVVFLLVFCSVITFGQKTSFKPTAIRHAVYSDVSQPLRDMTAIHPAYKGTMLKEVPNKIGRKEFNNLVANGTTTPEDIVWQKNEGKRIPLSDATLQNFEGISNLSGVYPPDTQGDIGPNHYIQVVNLNFAIFSRTGSVLYGPASLSSIWDGIPSPWNGTNNGDPVVLYDQAANRWIISQFSLPNTTQYAELIAISQTSDPTGAWYRYVFEFGSNMPDYPKLGVWNDGYYLSVNQFYQASSWAGVGACALERNKMLIGDPTAQMVYFDLGASSDPGNMLPSDWDGTVPPITNEPNHFTYFNDWSSATEDYLKIWDFHVDWTTPANSTFAEVSSLVTTPFDSELCTATRGRCIPQPGTSVKLESLSDRLMYRLQYRNFSTHRSMVTNHTVDVDGSGRAGIRWYELRNTGSGWSIYQQGTYSPDASCRWVGSLAMNSIGDMALGYSVSDATSIYPSIRYTGRFASDPLGQMTFSEQNIMTGTGYQSGSSARWGDYSMMSVDPVDDGTFWYTTEYIQTTGTASWQTRIASFLFGPVPPVANFVASTTKPCINSTMVLTDQTSGIPASWSWTITPGTFSYVDGTNNTTQNPHVKFTAFGNYTISLTATNSQGSNTITKTNYISVNNANADFTASSTSIIVNNSTTFTDASTCSINSWLWNFGAGASPATANTQGPHTVTYTTTGQKTVSLTVNGTVTETKTSYITVSPPIFNMSNATITTCTGDFYDPGGSAANYNNNQDFTMVFNPSVTGNVLKFTFTSFELEAQSSCSYDYLKIYDGNSTSAALIGTYCGTTSPGIITANNSTGSLTFVFHSDVSLTYSGWAASIECVSGIVTNPGTLSAMAAGSSGIDLSWTKNAANNDVMVIWSSGSTFGTPVNGTAYQPGNSITGGGTVLYRGSATSFNHAGLSPNTTYYYKAFSYDGLNTYSTGITANATTLCATLSLPFSETFPTSSFPSCWSTQQSGTGATNKWTVSNTANAGGTAYEMKSTYQSVNPGVTRLVTVPINTVGMAGLNLSFRHMFDAYSAGCTLRVQSSPDGTNWTNEAWSVDATSNNIAATLVNTTIASNTNTQNTMVAFTIEGNLYNYDYWYIDNVTITGIPLTLSVTPGSQVVSASAVEAAFTVTSNGNWTVASDQPWCNITPSGSGNGTITATFTQNTSPDARVANITVTVQGIAPITVSLTQEGAPYKTLNLIAFPEGFFNGSALNQTHHIDNYGVPVNHFGGSTVDTLSICLAQPVSPWAVLFAAHALPLSTSGNISVPIPSSFTGSYYVIIRHRQSIETWSKNPVSFAGSIINYNFTSAAGQAFGNNMKDLLGNGTVWGLFTGDLNHNGYVELDDVNAVYTASRYSASGYMIEDIDGDGYVEIDDVNKVFINSKNGIGYITPANP